MKTIEEFSVTYRQTPDSRGDLRHSDVATAQRTKSPVPGTGKRAEPLRGARRVVAHTMSAARDQTALSTICDDADIEGWLVQGDYMPRFVRDGAGVAHRAGAECMVRSCQQFTHPLQAQGKRSEAHWRLPAVIEDLEKTQ